MCPFCVGVEARESELDRIGGIRGDSGWEILVIPNKYPFSAHHEVVIDSPSHTDSIETFPQEHLVKLLKVYKERYIHHHRSGQVCIFHNRGKKAGESISHSHTQIVVIPDKILLPAPYLVDVMPEKRGNVLENDEFDIFCPEFSEWPDEVWIMPKRRYEMFGEVKYEELDSLATSLQTVVRLLSLRHQDSLAYNFSIFHGDDWYLRIVPREKVLGGFEIATNVSVNTQDPQETFTFLKEHFYEPDIEKIYKKHKANYSKRI